MVSMTYKVIVDIKMQVTRERIIQLMDDGFLYYNANCLTARGKT